MAKVFQLPEWRMRFIERKYRRKAAVVTATVLDMEAVMQTAVDQIMAAAHTGRFVEPDLASMFAVTDRYYRRVIVAGWETAKDEAAVQGLLHGHRLARIPGGKIPPLRDLVALFRDKHAWPSIMKRSRVITERLKRAYLQKLKRKFNELVPKMLSGEKSPTELRAGLMSAWDATKSRVATIFQSETTEYFTQTQLSYFHDDKDIIGFLFDSVRDTSRTNICRNRHGLIFRPGTELLRKNAPKLHWNCRSHLIALANTPHNREMLADPERDPSKKQLAPLPEGFRR